MGFSRQEHWSGVPFPSPMHESERWKWLCLVMSDSSWPQGLQPTRRLRPWDFPGKSTGVGCHFLLQSPLAYSETISILFLSLSPLLFHQCSKLYYFPVLIIIFVQVLLTTLVALISPRCSLSHFLYSKVTQKIVTVHCLQFLLILSGSCHQLSSETDNIKNISDLSVAKSSD